jgi:hypothetical protein
MRAADGQLHFVHATREHPFWTNTGWVAAYELEPGDQLLTARGGWATLVATYERQVAATTFNLTVDGLPTFYVSLPDASVAVLVHNNGFGSGAGQHYADFRVESATGEARVVGNVVSGRMTAEEGALGFPRSSLATHTEARLTRVVALQPGETLIIEGGLRPCPSCRGAMRSVARSSQATVVYRWTEAGVQRTWTSVRGRAGRVTISRPTCP